MSRDFIEGLGWLTWVLRMMQLSQTFLRDCNIHFMSFLAHSGVVHFDDIGIRKLSLGLTNPISIKSLAIY